MNDFRGLYAIRDAKPEDVNFILSTFLRGLYYGDSWFSLMPKDIFMDNYKAVASALLLRHKVRVACLKEDDDTILGYSIVSLDSSTVHWVYVRDAKQADGSSFRKKGIAKSLVPADFKQVSHLTKLGLSLMKSKFPNVTFNPFAL
jgi:hypothetical protein